MVKVKVVAYGDYLERVKGQGGEEKRKEVLRLIYSENEVIDKVEVKGMAYFITKTKE